MSGDTLYQAPRRYNVSQMRVHDYLYDSTFIVSGARDYARTSFKAAMESAQMAIQPVYKTMFSEIRKFPRMHLVYHPNCRLPDHMDRTYAAYVTKVQTTQHLPSPELSGKDQFKYIAFPKKVLSLAITSPEFLPPSPLPVTSGTTKPRSRGTQSVFRESSAQTVPWQPDGRPADSCGTTPEVLYLDKLEWGPGCPYRTGDLPADFHTTEIINKMRHARKWMEIVEKSQYPRWMKKREAIITDVEMKDWIFREAEIDELQDIRLSLLHKLQSQQREKQSNKTSTKLAKLWHSKKEEMERKIHNIRRSRDRELRKLTALHGGGGRAGLVQRMKASRGGGSVTGAAHDPTSDVHAPLARHGHQARGRHAEIYYDPGLLSYEDHLKIAEPPSWLDQCGQNLKKSCSGHHLPRDPTQLCERETKWSEQFLENLHNDLKKARLGAAVSAGPLRVLKPRRPQEMQRPATPEVEGVAEEDELLHQSALLLQRIIRGRAVQNLMYEGRTRAAELTEELKTTHGLQEEDRIRIAKEETRAREYNALRTEGEQKDAAISALVEELCGGAVSTALDFLEKELRRLREERKQHAFILIALREKTMREAAEAGRRQKEEQRRREHDEMFKQVLGVTQETVEAYLCDVVAEGAALAAEEDALQRVRAQADVIDRTLEENSSVSTAEEHELVAALVQQFLLPNVHKTAAKLRVTTLQDAKLGAARSAIFGELDEGDERKSGVCVRCGVPLGETCHCDVCDVDLEPVETAYRDDWRWKMAKQRPRPEPKTYEERFPPSHRMRSMLNELVDDVVIESRRRRTASAEIIAEYSRSIKERVEVTIDAMGLVNEMVERAMGVEMPLEAPDYHYFMKKVVVDALERSQPHQKSPYPTDLPSEIRRKEEEKEALLLPGCHCTEEITRKSKVQFGSGTNESEEDNLLPSELRYLEELRRCKCDSQARTSPATTEMQYEQSSATTDQLELDDLTEEEREKDPENDQV